MFLSTNLLLIYIFINDPLIKNDREEADYFTPALLYIYLQYSHLIPS